MADIYGMLDELQHRAAKEDDIKEKLLATRWVLSCQQIGFMLSLEMINDQQNEYYYIDKIELIAELLEEEPMEVTLITRPRRFGKKRRSKTHASF